MYSPNRPSHRLAAPPTARWVVPLTVALLTVLLAACGSDEPTFDGEEARSDKARITSPQVSSSDYAAQVAGNSAFAFDLYQQVRSQPGNLFYSPHSISVALAMLQAGARGQTEQQVAQTMHFSPQNVLHPALDKLDLELASRSHPVTTREGQPFTLKIVNAIWGQRGFAFQAPFLDTLALNYGAGLRLLDFATQPEPSRKTINDWVAQQTAQRIKDLLTPESITTATRLVLTNAIYFNAGWENPFEPANTKDEAFTRLDGTEVKVPTMNAGFRASFAQGSGYQAAALPYFGKDLSMLVIVPDAGTFASFEAGLDAPLVTGIIGQLKSALLTIKLPKFEFETPLKLSKTLSDMGMTDAFIYGQADLSGIDGTHELFVTDVLHKAFVKLDEKGTEAAAATAVVVAPGSAGPDPATLEAVRPFIFLIWDHATGAILFVGRVVDPS